MLRTWVPPVVSVQVAESETETIVTAILDQPQQAQLPILRLDRMDLEVVVISIVLLVDIFIIGVGVNPLAILTR